MTNSIRRRLAAIEKKACLGERMVTLSLGKGPAITMTANALQRIIMSVQGTCLKPVPIGNEPLENDAC
jgi:hypothetical protein